MHLVGSVPGPDQPVELQYLLLDPPECRQTRTGYLRNSLIVWIGYDIEQLLDTVTPDRCNDPPNSARWARIALITAVC